MSKKLLAVFTIMQNEVNFTKVWAHYYNNHVGIPGGDLYVLDHDSKLINVKKETEFAANCHVLPVHNKHSFSHDWLRGTVERFFEFLLQSYEWVLFAEADEILHTDKFAKLWNFVESLPPDCEAVTASGYEVVHLLEEEEDLDWLVWEGLLQQRKYYAPSRLYTKTLLSRVPLKWSEGFHQCWNDFSPGAVQTFPHFRLLHLHRLDYEAAWQKVRENAQRNWSPKDRAERKGLQNSITDPRIFRQWFYHPEKLANYFEPLELEPMPESVRSAL